MRPIAARASLAALTLAAPLVLSAQRTASYHVAARATLGGEGGWDYLAVDTTGHRVFLSRGTHVVVVDERTDSVVGDIPDTPGVHGIAFAPALGRGYISNGRDSSVTVFDLKTLAPVARVRGTGVNPDAIAYDSASNRVFTFNGRSNDATVIDAASNRIVGTIPLGGKPEFAVTDGKVVATPAIGDGPDAAAFDPGTRLAFASGGDGTLTVIHEDSPDQYSVVQTVQTQRGARTMTIDPQTHVVYTVSAEFGPPPAPAANGQRQRPPMVPGSFVLLVVAP